MASTSANAVVLQVPYCILQDFNFEQPFTLTLKAAGGGVRDWPLGKRLTTQVFCYNGETILFSLPTRMRSGTYTAFNLLRVDPSTGTTTLVSNITVPSPHQYAQVGVALDAVTWVPTLTVANYS